MSILSKAGPLGEKLSATADRLQRSVEEVLEIYSNN